LNLVGGLHSQGSAMVVKSLNRQGGLPTRNFKESVFDGAESISGRKMTDTILVGRGSCYACPVHCKRKVSLSEPYQVDPIYGGPEYETLAALGSNCGIDDLAAIAKGNELCNAYGLDTISTGAAIAFAMECFENSVLNKEDTDGLELVFGDASAMLKLIDMITNRRGIGDVLADGVARAAARIGKGAEAFALHVKKQEIPMHEPRYKQGLGIGYAVSSKGADHTISIHDSAYVNEGSGLEEFKALGILSPLSLDNLGSAKVRMVVYDGYWKNFLDCVLLCNYIPFDYHQVEELVQAVTGWNCTVWELMKIGERCLAMTRAFNIREGFDKDDDSLPHRFLGPLPSGPMEGVSINRDKFLQARDMYYSMMGWDEIRGAPALGKLQELDIEWVYNYIGGINGDKSCS